MYNFDANGACMVEKKKKKSKVWNLEGAGCENDNNNDNNDTCHYVWQNAQTATLHYTRGPAE